jgi:hypothetical protein
MIHVSFDGFQEIWDKVSPSFELHIDLCPCVIYAVFVSDDSVVVAEEPEQNHNNNQQYD